MDGRQRVNSHVAESTWAEHTMMTYSICGLSDHQADA